MRSGYDQGCTPASLCEELSAAKSVPSLENLNRKKSTDVLKIEVIMKKILLMIALLGVLGLSSQANAGVHVGIGIGVGGGYYAPGYYYGGSPYGYPGYYGPAYGYYGPGYYPWYGGYWRGGYYGHGG